MNEKRVSIVTTTVLDTVLPKVRANAVLIPQWLREAKAVPYAQEPDGKRAISILEVIEESSWEAVKGINKAIDYFDVDRSKFPYKHIPESESEL